MIPQFDFNKTFGTWTTFTNFIWIEIRNKKSKNIIIGCIYRHPHYHNAVEFIDYVNKSANKINKENKEVYICGDFNFDLLKYENVNHCQEFYNTMTCNGYLPHITIPTRITDSSMTIIDNMYTNTFSNNILSGNILAKIADHLPQFISIQRKKPDLKKKLKSTKGITRILMKLVT